MVIDTEKTELVNPFIDIDMGVSRVILNYRVAPRILHNCMQLPRRTTVVCNYLKEPLWYIITSTNHCGMLGIGSPYVVHSKTSSFLA